MNDDRGRKNKNNFYSNYHKFTIALTVQIDIFSSHIKNQKHQKRYRSQQTKNKQTKTTKQQPTNKKKRTKLNREL